MIRRLRDRRGVLRRSALAFAGSGLLVSVALIGHSADGRTARDGIFSAAQAERGERAFLWECMDCHEMAEFTAPRGYFDNVDGETVWEVFDYIWRNMPEDRPSWLRPRVYADILAYMFSEYGLPAGDTDMPTEREPLERITIVAPAPE